MTKLSGSNLFLSWRKLKRMQGFTLTNALDQLNSDLGTRFKVGRFSEWESGLRFPSSAVFRYLYAEVLPSVVASVESLSDKDRVRLLKALSLPDDVGSD